MIRIKQNYIEIAARQKELFVTELSINLTLNSRLLKITELSQANI